MEFTYKFYETLIKKLEESNYTNSSYHDYHKFKKTYILRHDVDNCLEKSLELAKVEYRLGVKSTYFILLSSNFYNIASKRSVMIIKEIKELGHEIGLHFDELKYDENINISFTIKKECQIMSLILDMDIKSVSMHRPSNKTLDANYKIDGIVNSYDKIFFNDFKYISDSRRNWIENPFDAIDKYDKLHILTHAFWYNTENKDIKQSVQDFVNKGNFNRYEIFKENIRNIEDILGYEVDSDN